MASDFKPSLSRFCVKNFRRFDSLSITSVPSPLVLMGDNGSGKTTLLWAFVLFFRGFNSLCGSSSHFDKKKIPHGFDLSTLLNFGSFEHGDITSILQSSNVRYLDTTSDSIIDNQESSVSETSSLSAAIDGKEYHCEINYTSSRMTIKPSPAESLAEKIRFAFMHVDSFWLTCSQEPNLSSGILSSTIGNMRLRFGALSPTSKDGVVQALKLLFEDFISLDTKRGEIFVISRLSKKQKQTTTIPVVEVEVSSTGAAFRKVFTALTLLWTLVDCSEKTKIFLIEEPEAQLHPSLHNRFLNLILRTAAQRCIQVVITSNSHRALDLFSEKNIRLLYGNKTHVVADYPWCRDAIHYHLLGSANKPLILCEGIDDEKFLLTIAPYFGVGIDNFVIKAGDGLVPHFGLVIETIRKIGDRTVVIVLDKDFRSYDRTCDTEGFPKSDVSVLCWDLPSIESYLFVHFMKKGYFCLDHIFDNEDTSNKLATAFTNGFMTQNKLRKSKNKPSQLNNSDQTEEQETTVDVESKKPKTEPVASVNYNMMYQKWNRALEAVKRVSEAQRKTWECFQDLQRLEKEKEVRSDVAEQIDAVKRDYNMHMQKVSCSDLHTIAAVTHGHTWCEALGQSTSSLISEVTEQIAEDCPTLKTLFGVLTKMDPQKYH